MNKIFKLWPYFFGILILSAMIFIANYFLPNDFGSGRIPEFNELIPLVLISIGIIVWLAFFSRSDSLEGLAGD